MSGGGFLKLAVIGDPVAHSAGPALFRGFFAEAGISGSYEALRVAAGDGAKRIAQLQFEGYRGLNVMTPLKEEALAACDRVSDPEAILAGSANVLLFQDDGTHGFNTDGYGALLAVRELLGVDDRAASLAGTRILVLGAGPTARAVIGALKDGGAQVALWNRTSERAAEIARRYNVKTWAGEDVDIVYSTLPPDAVLDGESERATRAARYVIDANYGPRATLGARLGREVRDGSTMLEHGARESFRLFSMPRAERFSSGVEKARQVWG